MDEESNELKIQLSQTEHTKIKQEKESEDQKINEEINEELKKAKDEAEESKKEAKKAKEEAEESKKEVEKVKERLENFANRFKDKEKVGELIYVGMNPNDDKSFKVGITNDINKKNFNIKFWVFSVFCNEKNMVY